jgi:hypothetical protein
MTDQVEAKMRPVMSEQAAFLNRLRSLLNIEGDQLPELTREQQARFMADPFRFFVRADDEKAAAIWREIEKRQRGRS